MIPCRKWVTCWLAKLVSTSKAKHSRCLGASAPLLQHAVSERRACVLLSMAVSSYCDESRNRRRIAYRLGRTKPVPDASPTDMQNLMFEVQILPSLGTVRWPAVLRKVKPGLCSSTYFRPSTK